MHDQNDLNILLQKIGDEKAVLLYFYNDDCPPCISLRPKVESLVTNDFPNITMVWVNSKIQPHIPAHYGVFANPTILVFFEGKEYLRFSKYVSVIEMKAAILRIYSILFDA